MILQKHKWEYCFCWRWMWMVMCGCTDPLEMQIPLMVKPLHHYSDQTQAPDWLRDANCKVREADAVVVVSAEYNHSIPPALSNLLDYFPGSSFAYKPSGIVCYSMGKSSDYPLHCRAAVMPFDVNRLLLSFYGHYTGQPLLAGIPS